MWLKFVLSGAVIAFCIFLGYLASAKYRQRKKFFGQLSEFNARYLNELSYERKPLGTLIEGFACSGDFKKTLVKFQEKHDSSVHYSYLTAEEKKECGDYFDMLGRGDAFSQKGFFEMQKSALEEKKTKSATEAKKRGELYLKLGLLAGLAIVILIV